MREALEKSAQRINSFARIHRQIYLQPDVISVNLKEYLEDLAGSLKAGAIPRNIKLSCDIPPVSSQRNVALALGLLLNELVTNAIKHAFPGGQDGAIAIRIRHLTKGWEFTVQDDGVGYNSIVPGLGTGLIEQFARQAGGELHFEHGSGTIARLRLDDNAFHSASLTL